MAATKQHYVGLVSGQPRFEYFRSSITPTRDTHGYAAVIGPFRTRRAALWAEKYGRGNPHFQHVKDAERLCKLTEPS